MKLGCKRVFFSQKCYPNIYIFQNLADNKLANGCASAISQILHQNVTLTHINLSGKAMGIKSYIG